MSTDPARRTVVGNISLSLDGRTTGPGGDLDMGWIVPHAITEGARSHMTRVIRTATTALLGRRNYQGFAGFWPGVADDENAHPADREFSCWLNATEKVVVSRTLDRGDWGGTRVVRSDPASTVRQLRREEGGDIVVLASASVIRALLAAGELDRLSITLCPEVVGGGARLFTDGLVPSSWRPSAPIVTESGALCLFYDRAAPADA